MTDCTVCLTSYDGDEAECYREQIVTAHVVHRCLECRTEIAIGERHEYVSGKWDGEWQAYRFCLACSEIGRALTCDGGRVFGFLWEDAEENLFPEMTRACFDKLTTAKAKQVLQARWRAWKFRSR